MSHLFLSYSRDDIQLIDELINRLRQAGCHVWIDRTGIQGGELYRTRIVQAITECEYFMIALSSSSIKSRNVRKELDLAEVRNKTILPILLEQVSTPPEMEYQLAGLHTIDMTNFDEGCKQLLKSLGKESGELPQNEFIEERVAGLPTLRQSTYDVSLQMAGTDKDKVIKLICEISGRNQAEARELALTPPKYILSGVTKTVAETAKRKLEAAGARIIIRSH
jgi:ribosomal protein L7/L12